MKILIAKNILIKFHAADESLKLLISSSILSALPVFAFAAVVFAFFTC